MSPKPTHPPRHNARYVLQNLAEVLRNYAAFAERCGTLGNFAELRGTARNRAELRGTTWNFVELRGTMRNYEEACGSRELTELD